MDYVAMSRSPPNRGYIPLSNAEPPPAYSPQDSARSSSLDARAVPAQPPVQPSVQQQQSSNVVVVNQPTQQSVQIRQITRPNDYLIVTVLLFLCCLCLGNFVTLLCLFPALILSIIASNYNDLGNYHFAKKFGSSACTCNIVAVLFSAVIILLGAVVVIVLLFILGLIAT